LSRIIKKLQTKRQKAPGVTIKETSRRVGPEGVNKWPNGMIVIMMMVIRRRRRIWKVTTGRDLTIRPYLIQSYITSVAATSSTLHTSRH
jgi:hypothetical protein